MKTTAAIGPTVIRRLKPSFIFEYTFNLTWNVIKSQYFYTFNYKKLECDFYKELRNL